MKRCQGQKIIGQKSLFRVASETLFANTAFIVKLSILFFGQCLYILKLRVPGVARVKFEAQKMHLIWLKINMRNS